MEIDEKPRKRYLVTWVETREVDVFAKSENEALTYGACMNGAWVKRDQYEVKEMD